MVSRALIVLALRAVALVAVLVAIAGAAVARWSTWDLDRLAVLLVYAGCALIVLGRLPQFAAIFGLVAASYREPLGVEDYTSYVAISFVLWLIALEHPSPLEGRSRMACEAAAAAALALLIATATSLSWPGEDAWKYSTALTLVALVILTTRLIRHRIFTLSRSWWLLVAFFPAALFLALYIGFDLKSELWIRVPINVWLILAPLGVVSSSAREKRSVEAPVARADR